MRAMTFPNGLLLLRTADFVENVYVIGLRVNANRKGNRIFKMRRVGGQGDRNAGINSGVPERDLEMKN